MGSIILLLWELGWDSRGPDVWIDADGNQRRFPADEEDGDPEVMIEALLDSMRAQLWNQAADHHTGGGMEHGVDCADMIRHLESLRKRGKH
eukprot:3848198-Pyramimonas_sp.AAC.1